MLWIKAKWSELRRWQCLRWGGGLGLLLLPLVGMAVRDDINWDIADFIVAAVLIFGTLALYEKTAGKVRNWSQRLAYMAVLAVTFVMIWGHLAIGIIGDGSHPHNRVYFLIGFINIAGLIVARFRRQLIVYALSLSGALTLLGLYWSWDQVRVIIAFHLIMLLTWLSGAFILGKARS